jgi:hypothetical protein
MKCTILFLAANPRETRQLALTEECKAVEDELRLSSGRDDFEFHPRWAVSVDDLMRHLNDLLPTVLHFSGHGTSGAADVYITPGAPHRDVESPRGAGIVLQDRDRAQYVTEQALARMIESASPATRLVVLNACHSDAIAASLRQVVECVVGVDGAIDDTAARSFAVGFYRALGNRRSVGNAVSQAAATLYGKGMPGEIVTCHPRDGIHADRMFLANPSAPPDPGQPRPAEVRDAATRTTSQLGGSGAWSAAVDPYDLFLAHPPANKSSARALFDLLRPDVRVFLAARSLSSSDHREQAIATAQRASRATVLLISPQSDAAWYLSDEVLNAIALHRASPSAHRLVPVLLEPGIALPHRFGSVEAMDATAVGFPAGVAARLREQVAAFHRDAASWSTPPPEPASDRRASGDHFRLYERLCRLNVTVFEQILAYAGIERGSLLPPGAALAERALDIAQLVALDPLLCRRVSAELDRRAPRTRR